jgi:hypothetical protein
MPTTERLRACASAGRDRSSNLARFPRPITGASVSRDLRRMSIIARDRHGDAWSMRVVKR